MLQISKAFNHSHPFSEGKAQSFPLQPRVPSAKHLW